MEITNNSNGSCVKVNLTKGVSSKALSEALTRIDKQELNIIGYESKTKTYRDETSVLRDNAQVSANNANVSATNANNSEISASESATIATTKASEASSSAGSALSSKNIATTKASEASSSANTASTKATEASNSAGIATTKATEASSSATSALASKNAAKTSENNAKTSEINAQQYAEVLNPDNYVKINENQILDGTITFTKSPIAPTPTTDYEVATKKYVDNKYSGFKNYIINGDFDIWQRGISFTDSGYTADRWKIGGSLMSVERATTNIGPNSLFGAKYKVETVFGFETNVELKASGNVSPFIVGKTYTISFYVHSTVAQKVIFTPIFRKMSSIAINQKFVTLTIGKDVLADTLTKLSYTFTMTTPNSDSNILSLVFSGEIAGSFLTFSQVQLEDGPIATPFEQRPIGLELSLCQRYYQKISDSVSFSADSDVLSGYQTTNSHSLGRKYLLPVPMCIAPTVQYVSLTTGYTGGTPTITASSTILVISLNASITGCNGNPYIYVLGLTLSAEL